MGLFSQNGPEKYQKSIRFSLKVDAVLRFRKTSKPLVKQRFEASKKLMKIPYKTCRLWSLLGSFLRNGIKKHQKSITFSTKSGRRFTTLQNIKKQLVKQCFEATRKVDENTL